jgi:hypothetical protein
VPGASIIQTMFKYFRRKGARAAAAAAQNAEAAHVTPVL